MTETSGHHRSIAAVITTINARLFLRLYFEPVSLSTEHEFDDPSGMRAFLTVFVTYLSKLNAEVDEVSDAFKFSDPFRSSHCRIQNPVSVERGMPKHGSGFKFGSSARDLSLSKTDSTLSGKFACESEESDGDRETYAMRERQTLGRNRAIVDGARF